MPYNSGSFSHSTLAGLRPGLLLRWTAPPPPRLLELEEPPLDASEPEDAESSFSEPEEAAAAPWGNPKISCFFAVLRIKDVYPGSRIRILSILDPGSEFYPSRIRIKEFKYFNPKICF
jgi:hypothetical protein